MRFPYDKLVAVRVGCAWCGGTGLRNTGETEPKPVTDTTNDDLLTVERRILELRNTIKEFHERTGDEFLKIHFELDEFRRNLKCR